MYSVVKHHNVPDTFSLRGINSNYISDTEADEYICECVSMLPNILFFRYPLIILLFQCLCHSIFF